MEDAITKIGIAAVLSFGVYRPDVASLHHIELIQRELENIDIKTIVFAIYQRGRADPLSYGVRRMDATAHSNPSCT